MIPNEYPCKCGGYYLFCANSNRDSVKFGAVMMLCIQCGKRTGWHKGFSEEESIKLAICEWNTINNVQSEAAPD